SVTARRCRCSASTPACSARTRGTHEPPGRFQGEWRSAEREGPLMRGALAVAPHPLSFLAFDFGVRRVGVATGNSLTRTATPLVTVAVEGEARLAAIAALVAEWRPAALVVGVPRHPDGAAHANTG